MSFPLPVLLTNERYVYLVPSETRKGKAYRVDLTANAGAGRCACIDFGTRRQVNIDAGLPWCTAATTCKHLRSVQYVFQVHSLTLLAKVENGDSNE